MSLTKVFDCLVTPLDVVTEHIAPNNLTYGYKIVGSRLLRYVFNEALDFKGCLLAEHSHEESAPSFIDYELIKKHNITSLIKHYCESSRLEIISRIYDRVIPMTPTMHSKEFNTSFSIQSLVLNASKLVIEYGTGIIFDYEDEYTYKEEHHLFKPRYELKDNKLIHAHHPEITSFYGFNGDDCKHENILKFLYTSSGELISKIQNSTQILPYSTSHHHNVTDTYIFEDHNDDTGIFSVMNIVIGCVTAILSIGIAYMLYRTCKYDNTKSNYDSVYSPNEHQDDNLEIVGVTGSNEIEISNVV